MTLTSIYDHEIKKLIIYVNVMLIYANNILKLINLCQKIFKIFFIYAYVILIHVNIGEKKLK
jgi:hypothetical protein